MPEETGLSVEIDGLVGVYTGFGADHLLNFVSTGRAVAGPGADGDERLPCRWFTIDEALAMPREKVLNPAKVRAILSGLNRRPPVPLDVIRESVYGPGGEKRTP